MEDVSKKMNRRSIESEFSTADESFSCAMWTKKCVECQKFNVKMNILFQDNTRKISLIETGKESSSNRTGHFDTTSFCEADLKKLKEVAVRCFPIDKMWVDCNYKLLVGN